MLWAAAMEGLNCSRDDALDLIEEICRLREFANLPPPADIPSPVQPTAFSILSTPEAPIPWDEEFPGNP